MSLPEHDWLLSLLVPITEKELAALQTGRRLVFKSLNPRDRGQVRGSGVFCGACQLPYDAMTAVERRGCRGAREEE